MTNLRFGITIPISVVPGSDPLGRALRAEALGFDFVSAVDHPATGEATHETWTMLSFIAARTSRIQIATKVLAVPLRSPAMTAKMAETFQRLSDGRLILGLGGGYSDEEIASLGLGHRTPGERIDGLEDAVHIIRGLWTEPVFTYAGAHHQVDRARIEPKPVASIPIWLGTFGPRALAVTGRLADGWIPSIGFAPPEAIPAMRDRVLSAASAAGRNPAEITYAYHMQFRVAPRPDLSPEIVSGPPELIAERLAGFASLGFTAMNFSPVGDDEEEQIEQLATEVLPLLGPGITAP
jgi:alkanesulfonate monooxygenase SsuD/methylene tetrahydromethanopterin reductase-like flavin-dependent oxidoreductase (luciferase family)